MELCKGDRLCRGSTSCHLLWWTLRLWPRGTAESTILLAPWSRPAWCHLLVFLMRNWSVEFAGYVGYRRSSQRIEETHVLVTPQPNKGNKMICKIYSASVKTSKGVVEEQFFFHQKQKYVRRSDGKHASFRKEASEAFSNEQNFVVLQRTNRHGSWVAAAEVWAKQVQRATALVPEGFVRPAALPIFRVPSLLYITLGA